MSNVADAVMVVGVGMTTSVGLSTPETAASVRSGTTRFAESRIYDRRFRPVTMAEVPQDGLPPLPDSPQFATLTAREARMLRLASAPLLECLRPIADQPTAIGLSLALPETTTTRPLDHAAFLGHLAAVTGRAFDPERSDASHTGRAGGLVALGQAVLHIQSGRTEMMICGGVDTYRDLYVLGTLGMEERVKSASILDGFIPGEGAAFLLLASARATAARGLAPLGSVSPVALGFEVGHLYSSEPYRGDGLAAAFAQLIASGSVDAPIGEVYSSMNGESHWAKEWGVGFLRAKAVFNPDHGMHHPADCCGDTGAASGPLMVGLAVHGLRGGYRRSPALVYASSDHGPRAAVVVRASAH
jgi:3-oxoacyl-[acyl-carrier-protein] synthase-1